jgi:TolB-like protein/Tfp pilus assembly protein PilF
MEEGQGDEILIELPKGGYAVTFERLRNPAPQSSLATAIVNRNCIVVLPFADHSPAGDLGYFCKGVSQEVMDQLAKVETARMVPWEAAQLLHLGDSRNVLGRLNAAMLISGSVRKSRDDIRVSTQIIDGASGCCVWSDSIDRKMDNIFAIQEEVAQSILKRLQTGQLEAAARSWRRPTENLAAHNLYVQGRYHMNQRTEEGLRKAVDFFERAIAEDPQYANAFSGLSDSYGLLGNYGALSPPEVWTKAASNAAWAVLRDDNSAEAHTSLAHVKATQDWDWLSAEREFQRALKLDSRYPTAHHWYAVSCLAPMARLDQALEEMLLAQALDPISSIIARDLAFVYFYRRDYESALEQCDHTVELNPHFSPAYWALGLIQEQMEDFDESTAAFQRALQLSPNSPRMHAALLRTLARSGRRKEALRMLQQLHDLAEKRYVSPFELGSVHFALGETDHGFEWLKKAFQDRCFELLSIKVDPRFDPIKSDSRFTALANQLGLP